MANVPLNQFPRKAYQDLSAGLISRPNEDQIPANSFHQLDNAVLADKDILERAPGYELDGSPFPDSADSFIRMLVNYRVGTSSNSLVAAALDASNANETYKVDLKRTLGDGTYNYIGYTTGTATFTMGSDQVTGTDTEWDLHLKAGDKIKPNGSTDWIEIDSVDDATTLTLVSNFGDATATDVTYMARIILNLNSIPVGLVFNNKLIIANTLEAMLEFDNTTVLKFQDTNAPHAALLEKHKARVFASRTAAFPSNLYWSKANDHAVWDPTSIAPIFPNDGGGIVQTKSFANSLLVFKDNGLIYQVLGEFDQDEIGAPSLIRKIDTPDNIGIIAGKSVVINSENRLYFLCETGIYTIDGNMHVQKISWDIEPDIQNLIFQSTATAALQFVYDTVPQWNSGTFDGAFANPSGQFNTFCDSLTISTAYRCKNGLGVALDSNNNEHISYSDSATRYPAYAKNTPSGTLVTEVLNFPLLAALLSGTNYTGIAPGAWNNSIALADNGNVGIGFNFNGKGVSGFGTNAGHIYYTERTSIGSATFTSGSNSVVGAGTSWSSQLHAGSLIKRTADSAFSVVDTVNSDTSITLTANYSGLTGSGTYVAWDVPHEISTYFGYTGGASNPSINTSISVKFNVDDPQILYTANSSDGLANHGKVAFAKRATTTWSGSTIASNITDNYEGYGGSFANHRTSITLSGSDIYATWTTYNFGVSDPTNGGIHVHKSTTGGASWTLVEALAVNLDKNTNLQSDVDGGGNIITAWGDDDSKTLKKRNHGTTTTTTLDAAVNSTCYGYTFHDGNHYAFNCVGLEGAQVEKYIFLSSSNVSSATPNVYSKDQGGLPNDIAFYTSNSLVNNGNVFASCGFGASVTQAIIRRVAFTGTWTSDVGSDASLSSWGTYVVTNQVNNGATITHQIGLGATSSLDPAVDITSGSIISTDSTLVFYQVIVTFLITSLSAATIDSIVLNYFGSGVDAKAPFGFIFNNEMYLSATRPGATSNDVVVFHDRRNAWGMWFPKLSTMARMGISFYGGSSTNGDVYKLKQGFNFAGSDYTLTAVTKEDFLGSLELDKEVFDIYVKFIVKNSGSFVFSYRTDNYKTVAGSTWVDQTVDQTKDGIVEVHVRKRCSSIQFKITQPGKDVELAFTGFVIMYGYHNVRG